MDPAILINLAVDYIFGLENNDIDGYDEFDKQFIYSIIHNINSSMLDYGRPTDTQIAYSIELSQYNQHNYGKNQGHIGLRENKSYNTGRRLAKNYREIYKVFILTLDRDKIYDIEKIRNTYDFEVCNTYHKFINSIRYIYDAQITTDIINRIKDDFYKKYIIS